MGDAAFSYDGLHPQTYYSFRYRVRAGRSRVIAAVSLTAANIPDVAALPDVVEGPQGFAIGDRNYWAPSLRDELAAIRCGHAFTKQRRLSLQDAVCCLCRGGGVERIGAAVEDAVQDAPDDRW